MEFVATDETPSMTGVQKGLTFHGTLHQEALCA